MFEVNGKGDVAKFMKMNEDKKIFEELYLQKLN